MPLHYVVHVHEYFNAKGISKYVFFLLVFRTSITHWAVCSNYKMTIFTKIPYQKYKIYSMKTTEIR